MKKGYGNDPESQNYIGTLYLFEQPPRMKEAAEWFAKSVAQNNAEGMFHLGIIREQDKGELQDFTEAIKLYRRAGELGHGGGFYNLALMYLYGAGVPKDKEKAIKFLESASETDSMESQLLLAEAYETGMLDSFSVEKDKAQSDKYRKLAKSPHVHIW